MDPIPASRHRSLFHKSSNSNFFFWSPRVCAHYVEPIGSAAPKLSSLKDRLNFASERQSSPLALICPAQGAPVPSFRSVLPGPDFSVSLARQ